ncbi:tyrosine-type recombinase/integrase [Aneurinibacillus sp. Ricciae_BoGa-3]|uniref:tyrosine-type recombinase/integrase n=1 Tax=Aneurinibacillus sp. Ricciae_BoGa-3 TaxID=3022697 RepID=UPI002340DA6B|nr:tyrosine-type recombinase/integrase [Aneurinibacillus sp. Ricciae_BoGa-3]WCK53890.1 tyrosine-type recombinase/integrase [Aneurinibacillus sp. Ricciae_BoGa-3]
MTKVNTSFLHPFDYYFGLFIRAKQVEGLKPRTIQDHKNHYKYLQQWLVERYPFLSLEELTADHIREYIHYMLKEHQHFEGHPDAYKFNSQVGLSPGTVNIRTKSLKCFLHFLHSEGHLKNNVAERIKLQRVPEDTIESFSKEEIFSLLSAPNQRTYCGFRDYVLMHLLFDTGMRISEVLHLKVDHVNFNNNLIHIPAEQAKNGKARNVPFTQKTGELLATLITENNEQTFEKSSNFIFLSVYGERLQYHQTYNRLKKYGKKVKIQNKRISPHTFRHTFAKIYILNGGDPFTLQKILGHHDLSMVRKYIQMNENDLIEQHEKNSPLAGM